MSENKLENGSNFKKIENETNELNQQQHNRTHTHTQNKTTTTRKKIL